MAGNYPDSIKPRWVRPGARRQEFTVISELTKSTTHWEPQLGRSRRCGGPSCELCHYGARKQLRVFLMAIDGAGNDWLLELRERHRETLDPYDSVVGLVIEVWRAGQAKNSPVEVKVKSRRDVLERDITALVASFGLEAKTRLAGVSIQEQMDYEPFAEIEDDRLSTRSAD